MVFNILIGLLFFIKSSFAVQEKTEEKFWVIANNIGITTISEIELKNAFLGYTQYWPNKNRVVVILQNSQTENFYKTAQIVNKFSAIDYKKHWLSLVFQGRAEPPIFFKTEAEIVSYVMATEGAIAIVFNKPSQQVNVIALKDEI